MVSFSIYAHTNYETGHHHIIIIIIGFVGIALNFVVVVLSIAICVGRWMQFKKWIIFMIIFMAWRFYFLLAFFAFTVWYLSLYIYTNTQNCTQYYRSCNALNIAHTCLMMVYYLCHGLVLYCFIHTKKCNNFLYVIKHPIESTAKANTIKSNRKFFLSLSLYHFTLFL